MAQVDNDLADEELADIEFNDDLAALEEKSSRMLRREMQALGVFESIAVSSGGDHEVALADPDFVFDEQLASGLVD
jgi:hypothetical protein